MPIKRTSIKMHIVTLCKIYIVSLLLSFTFIFFFCQIISEFMFFFFFSSRRRHTRSLRDWSQTCALPISERGAADRARHGNDGTGGQGRSPDHRDRRRRADRAPPDRAAAAPVREPGAPDRR